MNPTLTWRRRPVWEVIPKFSLHASLMILGTFYPFAIRRVLGVQSKNNLITLIRVKL